MMDCGKFQTINAKFAFLIKKSQEMAQSNSNFIILGEVGSGRRLMTEFLHEHSQQVNFKMVRYAHHMSYESVGAIVVEDLQFMNVKEQEILLESICLHSSRVKWYATASPNFFDLVDKGFVKRDFLKIFPLDIKMPSLSDRREDVPMLAERILQTMSWLTGRVICLSQDAKNLLQAQTWNENISELERVVETAAIKAQNPVLQARDFKIDVQEPWSFKENITLADMEKKLIMQTLQITNNNKTQAARRLGISIRTLRNKLSQYRMEGMYESVI